MATFHFVMYPWFAMGHITPFLNITNKLAERGHKISFLLPPKTKKKIDASNLHPNLITFIPVALPHLNSLPPTAETTNDIPPPLFPLLMTAMDHMEPTIEVLLRELQPNFIVFDFCYWVPALSRKLGIKSIRHITNPVAVAFGLNSAKKYDGKHIMADDLINPLESYLSSMIKLHPYEAEAVAATASMEFGSGISFMERYYISCVECDAIAFRSSQEIEGPYCDYIGNLVKLPILLYGSAMPEPPAADLEEKWGKLFSGSQEKSIVYCALGSECILGKQQFQELVLGLELTGFPFLAALKPPMGYEEIEPALPEGFQERVKGKGFVYGGWVQQRLILKHPSVGCFITHCGTGSLSEAMVSECQLVFLPQMGDQFFNARMMAGELRVGVEVEKGEDGFFTRNDVYKAVMAAMDRKTQLGKELEANHAKWKKLFTSKDFQNSYIDSFINKLHSLV